MMMTVSRIEAMIDQQDISIRAARPVEITENAWQARQAIFANKS
jgi:hypothetical protein